MDTFTRDYYSGNLTVTQPDEEWINTSEPAMTTPTQHNTTTDIVLVFPEPYETIRLISVWLIIPLVIASLIGNTLIIIIMSKTKNRNSSTSVFFTALAVSDMFMAVSVALERWLIRIYNINMYGIDVRLSIIKVSLVYANIELSSWMLVFITMERMTCIALPYLVKEVCTKKLAQAVVVSTTCVFIAFNVLQFTQLVDLYIDNYNNLQMSPKVAEGGAIITWIDFTFTFFIPLAVIGFGSIFILVNLVRVRIQKHDRKVNRNKSVTRALLAANLVFVLTMSPYPILKLLYSDIYSTDLHSQYLFWTLADVFMLLSDMNCSLNFFVYVLSGTRFRGDVMVLFCQRKPPVKRALAIPSSTYKETPVVSDSIVLQSTSDLHDE